MNTAATLTVGITNRLSPCTCGCRGRDSWHAAHFSRVVRNVEIFGEVREESTKPYGRALAIASGTVKLPRGETRVVFVVAEHEKFGWYRLGWTVAE